MGQIPAFHITFFCFPNAVWASVSGAFLIVFDALSIIIIIIIIIFKTCASTFIYTTLSETQHRLCTISDC